MQYADVRTLVLLSAGRPVGDREGAGRGRTRPRVPCRDDPDRTTTQQSTVTSTSGVAADVRAARMAPPAITVVGKVVDLRETLSWFETKPLFGWRVLVPRTKEQAGSLSARLRGYGAVPEEVPTISVEPPRNPLQMDKAVRGLVEGRYEWIAFTSVNAVKAVREKFEEYGLDARAFSGLKIATVGDKTAAASLTGASRRPGPLWGAVGGRAAGRLAAYDQVLDPINRVFLPRADIATENLVAGLIELGWECDDVTAYRTVRAAPPPAPMREAIKTGKFDAVVFTSSSTVRNLVGIAGKPHAATVIAVIGPQTAKTCEEHGLRVDVLARSRCRGACRGAGSLRCRATGWPSRGRRAGDEAVRREVVGRGGELLAMTRGVGSDSRPRRLRSTPALRGWSPRRRLRPAAGPADVRPRRHRRARGRSPRCRASSSTPSTPCARPPPRPSTLASAGSCSSASRRPRTRTVPAPATRTASSAWPSRTVAEVGDATVMSDLCLDEFTDHGHCGVLDAPRRVDNDATLERYAEMAVAQAPQAPTWSAPAG